MRCQAKAVDRGTERVVWCILRAGHKDSHFWDQREGEVLYSAAWYGPDDGTYTMIGSRVEEEEGAATS